MTRPPSPALYAWLCLAAVVGGALREAVVHGWPAGWVPGPVLVVNLIGSLMIGAYWGLAGPGGRFEAAPERRIAITTGFLGSLTTFSMFAVGVAQTAGQAPGEAIVMGVVTVVGAVGLAWLGRRLTRPGSAG